jgi:hypothetical protein
MSNADGSEESTSDALSANQKFVLDLVGKTVEPINATKAVIKLLDTCAGGIGKFLAPYHERRTAQATADEMVIKKKAEIEITSLEARAAWRIADEEVKRQQRREAVLTKALPHMKGDVSDEPVDPDWTTTFFNVAQDISNEQMQELLSKLLAGEVAQPGTFSRRTVAAVQHMSPEELRWFEKVGALAWRHGRQFFLPRDEELSNPFADYGVHYSILLHLGGMGLLLLEGAGIRFRSDMDLWFGESTYVVADVQESDSQVCIYPITATGSEILWALKVKPDQRFEEPTLKLFQRQGGIVAEFVERYAREILDWVKAQGIDLD